MSLPPLNPDKTAAGIALDPGTLERVIPESRRPDGSVRKQIKIRPGFTPQEDVRRFRGTKQTQMDVNALPKGHIIGWVPPTAKDSEPSKSMSKSAKKNAKRREKKAEDKKEVVKDNWEDDEDDTGAAAAPSSSQNSTKASSNSSAAHTAESPNWAASDPEPSKTASKSSATVEALASKMEKLDVQ